MQSGVTVTVTVTATGMINQADWHGLDEERTGIERGRPEKEDGSDDGCWRKSRGPDSINNRSQSVSQAGK